LGLPKSGTLVCITARTPHDGGAFYKKKPHNENHRMNLKRLKGNLRSEKKHLARVLRLWWRHKPSRLRSARRRAADEVRRANPAARTPRVNTKISESDRMYKKATACEYFLAAYRGLDCIDRALARAGKKEVSNILDLPCGHGRVLRVLKAAFPKANITACDLERDGVDFCAGTLKVTPLYSKENLDDLEFDAKFDLIWVGSLFTHIDAPLWPDFLRFFSRVLADDGVLIFTTHGRRTVELVRKGQDLKVGAQQMEQMIREWEQTGFGYCDYKPGTRYGVSLSSEDWVRQRVAECPGLTFIHCDGGGWGGNQDAIICGKAR
jgi:SAM-dependent methyltransferase